MYVCVRFTGIYNTKIYSNNTIQLILLYLYIHSYVFRPLYDYPQEVSIPDITNCSGKHQSDGDTLKAQYIANVIWFFMYLDGVRMTM